MNELSYMSQGTVNGRRSTRARHLEAIERERVYGRIMSAIMLVSGCLIGSGITLMVLGVI